MSSDKYDYTQGDDEGDESYVLRLVGRASELEASLHSAERPTILLAAAWFEYVREERSANALLLAVKEFAEGYRDSVNGCTPSASGARPPKPAECEGGCPPKQVCDHCQWPTAVADSRNG